MKNLRNILVFLGPPGCGKGSLSSYFVKSETFFQLSTGNLCRKFASSDTLLGKEIDFLLKSGKLISDDLILDMVKSELNDLYQENLILDGFPRTENQAKILYDFLKNYNVNFNILRFEISEDLVVDRLSNRIVCSNKSCQKVYSLSEKSSFKPKSLDGCDDCNSSLSRRSDDMPEVVRKRFQDYSEKEKDVLNFYSEVSQPVINLDASKPASILVNEVTKLIK